jgi:glutaredoxin
MAVLEVRDEIGNEVRRNEHGVMKASYAISPSAWRLRCPKCNRTKSLLEAGGFRFAALSFHKRILAWCSGCKRLRFAAVETQEPSNGESRSSLQSAQQE